MHLTSFPNSWFRWSYTGLVVVCAVDLSTKFMGFNPASAVLSQITPFEKSQIMLLAYPAFMQGANVIASVTYVDKFQQLAAAVARIESYQKQLFMEVRQLNLRISQVGGLFVVLK